MDFIEWSWTPVADVSGYDAQYSTNEAFTDEDEIIARAAEEISYRREGLDPETSGYLRVRSATGMGEDRITSDWSTHVTGMTAARPIPPPPAPTGLRVTDRGETFIEWGWRAVPGANGYQGEFSTDPGFSDPDSFERRGVSNTSVRVSNLDADSDGYFRVRAYTGSLSDRVFGDWSESDKGSTSEPPPPTSGMSFGAGTWLVGSDIEAGRYFANPRDGCYWERLSGLSGTLDDIIANEFIGFDSPQEIVDIGPSDLAFNTDEDCRRWDQSPEPAPRAGTIPPGTWLVGEQVEPGVYAVDAGDGCYWERLSGFGGSVIDDVLANDFVSGGGRQLVEIERSDVGFSNDEDCGTWRAVGGAAAGLPAGATTSEAIEANRLLHEAHRDRHRH